MMRERRIEKLLVNKLAAGGPGGLKAGSKVTRAYLDELPRERPILVHCKTGYRSMTALGILRAATPAQVKAAHRRLAKRYHPDNTESGDEEKFRQVHTAYEILLDPERLSERDISIEDVRQAITARNRDISGGQEHFWLSSSLEISAQEQIRFMDALDREALPATGENQAVVKQMMLQNRHLPDDFQGELYGKTGSCVSENSEHGWFTGFMHRDGKAWVFAVNVTGAGQWGWQARDIAIKVLSNIE